MSIEHLVFVYGTLQAGQVNHHLLAGAPLIARAATAPEFRLVDLGPYPALVRWPDEPLAIQGEVYRIERSVWPLLDELEEEGTLYQREQIEVASLDEDNRRLTCWTYTWKRDTAGLRLWPGERWPESSEPRP